MIFGLMQLHGLVTIYPNLRCIEEQFVLSRRLYTTYRFKKVLSEAASFAQIMFYLFLCVLKHLHKGKLWFIFWKHSLPWCQSNSCHTKSLQMSLPTRENGSKLSMGMWCPMVHLSDRNFSSGFWMLAKYLGLKNLSEKGGKRPNAVYTFCSIYPSFMPGRRALPSGSSAFWRTGTTSLSHQQSLPSYGRGKNGAARSFY